MNNTKNYSNIPKGSRPFDNPEERKTEKYLSDNFRHFFKNTRNPKKNAKK